MARDADGRALARGGLGMTMSLRSGQWRVGIADRQFRHRVRHRPTHWREAEQQRREMVAYSLRQTSMQEKLATMYLDQIWVKEPPVGRV